MVDEERALIISTLTVSQAQSLYSLLLQVDMDALELLLHGQNGARPSQARVFLSHHLPQAGVQVIQLLMESSAELLQEGGVPGSRGALCVEEVEALLEHLVEHRDGLDLLELVTLCHLLGKTEAFSVLQTGVRGESVLSGQEPEVLPGIQHESPR